MNRNVLECLPPDITWLLYTWMHSYCGNLQKTCKKPSQLKFSAVNNSSSVVKELVTAVVTEEVSFLLRMVVHIQIDDQKVKHTLDELTCRRTGEM